MKFRQNLHICITEGHAPSNVNQGPIQLVIDYLITNTRPIHDEFPPIMSASTKLDLSMTFNKATALE